MTVTPIREALEILSTIEKGTAVGRFLLQTEMNDFIQEMIPRVCHVSSRNGNIPRCHPHTPETKLHKDSTQVDFSGAFRQPPLLYQALYMKHNKMYSNKKRIAESRKHQNKGKEFE